MLLSIIVTVYNLEKEIRECLESLEFSDIYDYEVIVVDDGSKDRSEEICKSFVLNHKKFRYYKKENGGLSDARNFGYSKCCGNFIWFFDGDDYLDSTKIGGVFEKLKENPEMLVFDYLEHSEKNEKRIKGWKGTYNSPVAAWNKVFSRKLLDDSFSGPIFPKNIVFEVYAIVPYLCYKAKSIIYLQEPIYIYRVSQNASLMSKNRYNINHMLKASEVLVNLFETNFENIEKEKLLSIVKPRLLDMLIKNAVFNKEDAKDKYELIMSFLGNHFENNIYRGICGLDAKLPIILARFFIQNEHVYKMIIYSRI